jgi:hypothetical protein
MNVMLCFEVSEKQEQVRKELAANGYMSSWKVKRGHDEITFNLPSNALWNKGEHMSPAKAKEDLKKFAKQHNVDVLRAVALVVSKWDGMTGFASGSEKPVTQSAEVTE